MLMVPCGFQINILLILLYFESAMKMSRVLRFVFYMLCAVMLGSAAYAQRTTRNNLRPAGGIAAADLKVDSVRVDTIVSPEPHTLDVNGYDKPLRSRRETFFATNNAKAEIAAMSFTITYYDTSHRMLHKASHHVPVNIPVSETRQVSIKSWDTQFAFYHVRSPQPRGTVEASPYEVTISVDTLFVVR